MESTGPSTHFSPALLKRAREACGLTAKGLGERVGRSSATISAYEKFEGGTKPPPDVVLALSQATGRPFSSFFRSPRESSTVGEQHWRARQKASIRYRHQVMALASDVTEVVDFLDWLGALPVLDLGVDATEVRDPLRLAALVRRAWNLGLGPLPDIVALLERRGIVVVDLVFEGDDTPPADGFTMWTKGGRPVIFTIRSRHAKTKSRARRRLTLLHELKHVLTDRDAPSGDKSLEDDANAFASALLLPLETWGREFPRSVSLPYLRELKKRWKASMKAMVYRASAQGLISSSTATRAYIEMAKLWGSNEPGEDEIPQESPKLLPAALKDDFLATVVESELSPPAAGFSRLRRDGAYGPPVVEDFMDG
ncbi:MAG TPA: XRE family transcriptional regulator [Myxococcota bacterium]|nr:XRE family transcriptional regulator [Myxococcota bacterium]